MKTLGGLCSLSNMHGSFFAPPRTHLVIVRQLRPADEHRFALASSKSRKNLQQRREGVKQILQRAHQVLCAERKLRLALTAKLTVAARTRMLDVSVTCAGFGLTWSYIKCSLCIYEQYVHPTKLK